MSARGRQREYFLNRDLKLLANPMNYQALLARLRWLRCFTAVSLCLVLISQVLLWMGPSFVQAQTPARLKKQAKKKRWHRADRIPVPFVLPSVSSRSSETRGQPDNLPQPPNRSSKSGVSIQRITERAGASDLRATVVQPVAISRVSIRSLSTKKKNGPHISVLSPVANQLMPAPGHVKEVESPTITDSIRTVRLPADVARPLVTSPSAIQNFQGEIDQERVGTNTFTIPPDTMGAVGISKVVSYLNNNILIQDKTTGAQLSIASINAFWASTGASAPFDPRIQYDPYNNRWIIAAVSNSLLNTSSILVGLSDTTDPEGTFTLLRFVVGCSVGSEGCAQGGWADFPMLGFNKNWIAIGWNQFTINTTEFSDGRLLVLNYPALRSGSSAVTLFSGVSQADGGFCTHPATTLSATEETLYMPAHVSSDTATYRLHKIIGTPGSPNFVMDPADRIRP